MSQTRENKRTNRSKTIELCYAGLFTAVIAIMAQISIPTPMGIPVTMQTFAIILAAVVLGSRLATISTTVYLLLGAVGVPVFAGFTGGIGKFMGPTAGFLLSYPIIAFIIGFGMDHRKAFRGALVLALAAGTLVNYTMGVAVYCLITGNPIIAGITACVLPFIITDIIKIVAASLLGFAIRKRLRIRS